MLLSASKADVLLFVPLLLPLLMFPQILEEFKVLLLLVPPRYLFMLVAYNVFLFLLAPAPFYIVEGYFP
jgi:hypothetical protein